ncbi:DUF488 domain-containing protein [Nanobdella aerobiophila]|nr:DUF488 domain-containing protein [Nanobdella aerobiophila]
MIDGLAEIYTLGHSNRNIKDFIGILKENNMNILVDVRSLPGSKKYPEYNKENLEKTLKDHGIEYIHIKELGGFRKPNKNSKNSFWINPSFRGFADYMQSDEFKEGIKKLIDLAKNKRVAIMCSEWNPYRCHRRLISDYLSIIYDIRVIHIININKIEEHKVTKSAKIIDGNIIYE